MIVLDYSQIILGSIYRDMDNGPEPDIELIRHLCLNSLRMYRHKFHRKHGGNMIVAIDSASSWRRDAYPHYKAGRRANKKKSKIDWNVMYSIINQIKDEIKEVLPHFCIIEVDKAEGDDIIGIAVLDIFSRIAEKGETCLIISSDKDFKQLHGPNVTQWAPAQKKFVTIDKDQTPLTYLREMILTGDSGDGVPNALSEDDRLVKGIKQSPITVSMKKIWSECANNEEFFLKCNKVKISQDDFNKHTERNKNMIALQYTPNNIRMTAVKQFAAQRANKFNVGKLERYLVANNLRFLHQRIGEFA